jgi:hypothetical protein
MRKLVVKVCLGGARTLEEEYDYLSQQLEDTGRFLPWEVHPNKLRAATLRAARLNKKIVVVMNEMIALGYC